MGLAFAPIYPLVVEKIGHRFPYYHPGFYNGIFSLAMAGGFLTPGLMGYIASVYGLRMIMLIPLVGSVVVFVLLLLIWLESRLRAYSSPPASSAHSKWEEGGGGGKGGTKGGQRVLLLCRGFGEGVCFGLALIGKEGGTIPGVKFLGVLGWRRKKGGERPGGGKTITVMGRTCEVSKPEGQT